MGRFGLGDEQDWEEDLPVEEALEDPDVASEKAIDPHAVSDPLLCASDVQIVSLATKEKIVDPEELDEAFYDASDRFENPENPGFSLQIENTSRDAKIIICRVATTILSFEHPSLFRPPLRFMFRFWRCHEPTSNCAPTGRKKKEHWIHEVHRIQPCQDREPLLFAVPSLMSATWRDLNPNNFQTVLTPTEYVETQTSKRKKIGA